MHHIQTQCRETPSLRPIHFRTLDRLCARIQCVYPTLHTSDVILQKRALFELFVNMYASPIPPNDDRQSTIQCIATELGMYEGAKEMYQLHDVAWVSHQDKLEVGMWSVPKGQHQLTKREARPFAQTRLANYLLSETAAAIALNEPLLLVGETGTGKTTTLQQLAMLSNVTFNA